MNLMLLKLVINAIASTIARKEFGNIDTFYCRWHNGGTRNDPWWCSAHEWEITDGVMASLAEKERW